VAAMLIQKRKPLVHPGFQTRCRVFGNFPHDVLAVAKPA
jgi:hypothetical protein